MASGMGASSIAQKASNASGERAVVIAIATALVENAFDEADQT